MDRSAVLLKLRRLNWLEPIVESVLVLDVGLLTEDIDILCHVKPLQIGAFDGFRLVVAEMRAVQLRISFHHETGVVRFEFPVG